MLRTLKNYAKNKHNDLIYIGENVENLLEARGYFWWDNELLASGFFAPTNNVSGVLTIDHLGQSHVQLNSFLSDKISAPDPRALRGEQPFSQDLHGILYDTDQYICLKQVRMGDSYISSGGPSYENMKAEYCLVSNNKILLTKKHVFRSVTLSLEPFQEWLNIQSINVVTTSKSVRILQKNAFDFMYKTEIGKISLNSFLTRPFPGHYSSIVMKENPTFELLDVNGLDIFQVEVIAQRLEEFLNLLSNNKIRLNLPKVKIRGNQNFIKFFYRRSERSTQIFDRHRVWVPFSLIKNNFGELFGKFHKLHGYFGPAFHLYLGIHRQESLYAEHKFANLVWGLESLHRRTSTTVRNLALQAKVDLIIEQISRSSDKEWLKRVLSASAEPSLEERIYELFANLLFSIDKDKLRTFSKRCAGRRNDLSHFGGLRETQDEYSKFVLDIVHLSNALDILYHAKILQEIGIEKDHIKNAVCDGPQSYNHKATLAWVNIPLM